MEEDSGIGGDDGGVQSIRVCQDDLHPLRWSSRATDCVANGQTGWTEFEMEAAEDAFDCTDDKTENESDCRIGRSNLEDEVDSDDGDNFADMIVKRRTRNQEKLLRNCLKANF